MFAFIMICMTLYKNNVGHDNVIVVTFARLVKERNIFEFAGYLTCISYTTNNKSVKFRCQQKTRSREKDGYIKFFTCPG